MSPKSLYDTILSLEESTWRALQNSGVEMLPYITQDCIMQFPLGLKVTSISDPSVKDILRSPAFVPWKDFELLGVDVLPVGPEGAVISYLAKASRAGSEVLGEIGVQEGREGGGAVEFSALCSSVWRFEVGEWRMCFHQQSMDS